MGLFDAIKEAAAESEIIEVITDKQTEQCKSCSHNDCGICELTDERIEDILMCGLETE